MCFGAGLGQLAYTAVPESCPEVNHDNLGLSVNTSEYRILTDL